MHFSNVKQMIVLKVADRRTGEWTRRMKTIGIHQNVAEAPTQTFAIENMVQYEN